MSMKIWPEPDYKAESQHYYQAYSEELNKRLELEEKVKILENEIRRLKNENY